MSVVPPQTTEKSFSLSEAQVECDLVVLSVGRKACRELRRMGFCEATKVRKHSNGDKFICTVCGTKVALSHDLAKEVTVALSP